eukprot:scaffold475_cov279-Pinguiococcus_pyrenoidosus.AAC.9
MGPPAEHLRHAKCEVSEFQKRHLKQPPADHEAFKVALITSIPSLAWGVAAVGTGRLPPSHRGAAGSLLCAAALQASARHWGPAVPSAPPSRPVAHSSARSSTAAGRRAGCQTYDACEEARGYLRAFAGSESRSSSQRRSASLETVAQKSRQMLSLSCSSSLIFAICRFCASFSFSFLPNTAASPLSMAARSRASCLGCASGSGATRRA